MLSPSLYGGQTERHRLSTRKLHPACWHIAPQQTLPSYHQRSTDQLRIVPKNHAEVVNKCTSICIYINHLPQPPTVRTCTPPLCQVLPSSPHRKAGISSSYTNARYVFLSLPRSGTSTGRLDQRLSSCSYYTHRYVRNRSTVESDHRLNLCESLCMIGGPRWTNYCLHWVVRVHISV
jgi:hypothetical protein